MAEYQTQSISREKFLIIAINLLHKSLVEASRTDAKNAFKVLSEGKALALSNVRMEDQSIVRFDVQLDGSEFVGNLNFGAFKTSLALLISNLSQALQAEKNIPAFTAQDGPEMLMFGVTAVTYEDSQPNVMVLGSDSGSEQASVKLKLMYLDPAQFADEGPAGASA
ncbi:MAG: hypothetical protein ABJ056_11600 [Halioglobus sp.]